MVHIIICSNLIEKDGKYLLVKETKKVAKDKYNFPSGTLELTESLMRCAEREAEEETGLKVKAEKLVGVFHLPKTVDKNIALIFVFKSALIGGEIKTSEKHPEVNYFSKQEITQMRYDGQLRHSYVIDVIEMAESGKFYNLSIIKSLGMH